MAANVKVLRYVSHQGNPSKAITKAKDHIKYIEADREHHRNNPHLFNGDKDNIRRQQFYRRIEDQPKNGVVIHKLVISLSEDERNRFQIDMKELARDTMARIEGKMNEKLDWVGSLHDDKGHPHVHIVIRGRSERNKQLYISKPLIQDMRKIADREKIRQAERKLGRDKVERLTERFNRDQSRGIERDREPNRESSVKHGLGGEIVKGLTAEFQKLLKQGEREIQKAKDRAKRQAERSSEGRGR